MTMNARWYKTIRFTGLLFATLLLYGCPTYPAFQNANIDYNGRWGEMGGGPGPVYNPYGYVDSMENMYQWSDETYGSSYYDPSGDHPQRSWGF
jgi:hypothetical protein